MSENTTSPSPTNEPSSTAFAVAPIVNLLKKPMNEMGEEELRAHVAELRSLRQNPHALGKALRGDAAEKKRKEKAREVEDEGGTVSVPKASSLEDLMKQLGG